MYTTQSKKRTSSTSLSRSSIAQRAVEVRKRWTKEQADKRAAVAEEKTILLHDLLFGVEELKVA